MSDVLAWANAECGAIPDDRFRAAAELHLDRTDPRSVRWLVEELTETRIDFTAEFPSEAQIRALTEAVELRLRAAIEDVREEAALGVVRA